MRKLSQSVTLISVLSVLVLGNVTNPAFAQSKGMNSHYIGISAGDGTLGKGGHVTIHGRAQLGEDLPLSARSSLMYAPDDNDLAWFGTLTYDAPIARNTNLYVGPGIGVKRLDVDLSLIMQAGLETAIAKNLVLFGDVTYLPARGEFPWKLGVGYRF